jgi:hypothetical protein
MALWPLGSLRPRIGPPCAHVLMTCGVIDVTDDISASLRHCEMPTSTPKPPVTSAKPEELLFQDVMPQIAHLHYAVAADQFLLVELLRDLARTKSNPPAYLDALYERALTSWEQSPPAALHQSKIDTMFREALSKRIAAARKGL